ncbi:ATP-binding protein [Pseudomonas stutzeri]|uniref:histidine kinase n=1 Tax=Stutzerimonas stutzeri TaxID=316 RepID=A0A2N8RXM8_STUST|nr:hybrid sensor histidine kinase/response regulator [Stutzerimonas stutzeri]MCQ4297253.1 ATP-binding protein [Stutzerimonas stutzeri]PNF79124.1 hybrid sensor histidine kinase/response regulator [Stutzerimonas stutzeri]
MPRYLSRLLALLLLAVVGFTQAEPICQELGQDALSQAQLLEDPGGKLTADQVLALSERAFLPATRQNLPRHYSDSAFWLRFQLQGSALECQRWLTVGDPRLADVQVHISRSDGWDVMRAGSRYPVEQWPVRARQPTFPLRMDSAEDATVLVRVASSSTVIIEPRLWSELGLIDHRQHGYLFDGLTLGMTLLVVPFSFVVGWILRSQLLAVHALSVLGYAALVSMVNGYLVYLPSLLPWSYGLMWLLGLVQYCLFLAYLRVLLDVRQLPQAWGMAYTAFMLLIGGCYLWVLIDHIQGRALIEHVRQVTYLLVPATLLAGWRRGFSFSWLVYLVCGLLMLQGLIRLLAVALLPWQSVDDRLSVPSTLPGLFLLACTLVLEVGRSRERERRALVDLDNQQKAEYERLESTVATRTGQLRESLKARSLLMARISHDLRSPLVSIVNYARLIPCESAQDVPRKIERNARQQLEMIDELLEFSRTELHQLEIILAPGYLYGFLREIEEEAGFLAAQQSNSFECRLDAHLPALVQADFRRLRQVLINLLANAAKFTRDGQVCLDVQCIRASEEFVCLRFSISDTGIGIAPGEHKQILQPFSRGHGVERYTGSGLGLSIVSELLQQMGSSLSSDESRVCGSCFSFEVVFAVAREEDLDMSFGEYEIARVDGTGRSILLVDDVEQNREWLSDLLGGYGFDVSAVADPQQALLHLHCSDCDLLISDQAMPGSDGWALLAAVRGQWPSLPVVLYSSAPPHRPLDYPDHLSFDAVLLKPSDASQILALIEQLTCSHMGEANYGPSAEV